MTSSIFEGLSRPVTQVAGPRSRPMAILLNANAKRVTPTFIESMQRRFPKEDVFVTQDLKQAFEICQTVLDRGYEILAVGGGDGTATHAMNHLLRAQRGAETLPKLAILRLGTGNALGCLTGAGEVREDLFHWNEGGEATERLSLIRDDDGFLFPFASVGYDARVLNDYEELLGRAKQPLARFVMRSAGGYGVAALMRTIPTELSARPVRFKVKAVGPSSFLDPETDEEQPLESDAVLFEGIARAVSLGTTPFYGYGLRALPFALRRRDRFQVRVTTAPPARLLRQFGALWRGTLRSPEIRDFLVEGVHIETDQPQPVQMAGEAAGYRTCFGANLSDQAFELLRGSRKPLAVIAHRARI
ncbi:MAG: diacylglycerol/lipid kinase family protein [Myxococcota bacterium]